MQEKAANKSPVFAGIEAGGTKFNCVLATDTNRILASTKIATTTPDITLPQVRDFFREQEKIYGPIQSIGIACFGPVDLDRASTTYGYITSTPKKGWSNQDIAGFFKREFAVNIGFDTDVNGAARGEFVSGAAQNVSDFVYITVGTGVGGGVFVNGSPVHGLVHPELGHMQIPRKRDDEFSGNCPFHGDCVEGLVSGPSIEARWGCTADTLAEHHPAWVLQAHYLALMCVNITLSYSPKLIILGGGVMGQKHLFPLIRQAFQELMRGYMLPDVPLDQYIIPPGLQDRAGEVGALSLAMMQAD